MFPALVGHQSIGAVQTRNLGTIAGDLGDLRAVEMDSQPTLMALEAAVTVASVKGPPADAPHRILRRSAQDHPQVR